MKENEYIKRFKSENKNEVDTKHIEAFKIAVDTRKFEIELYWKRATYFWAFIAVTFAGYGLSRKISGNSHDFIEFFLCCFGFILSLGWFFANKGSKQWQENWEHHVDHLGEEIAGPIYKLVLRRRNPKNIREYFVNFFTGPSKHSVSKINQLISLYIAMMWLILIYSSRTCWNLWLWQIEELLVLFVTFLASLGICFGSKHSLVIMSTLLMSESLI